MKSKPTYINKKTHTHLKINLQNTKLIYRKKRKVKRKLLHKQQLCGPSSKNLIEKKEISNPIYQLPTNIYTLTLLILIS